MFNARRRSVWRAGDLSKEAVAIGSLASRVSRCCRQTQPRICIGVVTQAVVGEYDANAHRTVTRAFKSL